MIKEKIISSCIPSHYEVYWNPSKMGGKHGTAMFVHKTLSPELVSLTLPVQKKPCRLVSKTLLRPKAPPCDPAEIEVAHGQEGRIIVVKVHHEGKPLHVVGTYVPNVGDYPKMLRLPYRVRHWDPDLCVFLEGLKESGSELVWCGDLNVAEHPHDVYDPKKQKGKGCYTDEERASFSAMRKRLGLHDHPRSIHGSELPFSFFSYRFKSVETNRGWRLDYLLTTPELPVHSAHTFDDPSETGKRTSDHLPISIRLGSKK